MPFTFEKLQNRQFEHKLNFFSLKNITSSSFIFERGKYRLNTFAKNAKWGFTVCEYVICYCHCQKKAS